MRHVKRSSSSAPEHVASVFGDQATSSRKVATASMRKQKSIRATYRDESLVASLMDLPLWVVLAGLSVFWLAGIVLWAAMGIFVPALRGFALLVGFGLACLFLAAAFWIGLGERSLRRRRLVGASNLYRLGALSSIEFEEAVSELFRLQGFVVLENKRPDHADGGVDMEITKRGETLLVQVKHKWAPVGVRDLRELWGIVASEGADGGVFVTSQGFTDSAREFAHGKRFDLIDGETFLRLRASALPTSKQTLGHDPVVSEGFAQHLAAQTAPACRKCGKPMVLMTKLTGTSVTSQFWGCGDFPKCQSSRPASPYLGETSQARSNSWTSIKDRLEIARTNRLRIRVPKGGDAPIA